jgi:sortase A
MSTASTTNVVILLCSLGALVFFVDTLSSAYYGEYQYGQEVTLDTEHHNVITESLLPERLHIPSLGIDAAIQQVGRTVSGRMGVPGNYSDVGWYKYGPLPGEQGSAVLAGHVDNALGLSGVFKHLQDMRAGDVVYVTARDGTKTAFVVTSVEIFAYDDAPVDRIFNKVSEPSLNLITCTGKWVRKKQMYGERVVVFTKQI